MEDNQESVSVEGTNVEAQVESPVAQPAKTQAKWYDSKSVQQLAERLASLLKASKKDSEESKKDGLFQELNAENRQALENLFVITAPRDDANDCLNLAIAISYLLYAATDKNEKMSDNAELGVRDWIWSIVESIKDTAFIFQNIDKCVEVSDKMTGKQIKCWFDIVRKANGNDFLAKLIFRLPYRCWGNIEKVFAENEASALMLEAVKKEFAEKHVTADLLYWLWKQDDEKNDAVMKLRKEYLTNAALLFKTLHQDMSGNYLKAQRDLRKLLLDDEDFQMTLMNDGEKTAVMELIRCTKRLSLLNPQERQSLLVHIYNLYPKYKDAIEERSKGPVRVVVGRLTSKHGYNKRVAELDHLIKVEIPDNSKAIEVARSHGDLRENSEFKFAKEQQRFLNSRRREWEESLIGLQVTDFSDTKIGNVIIPGCTVVLQHADGKLDTIHLLGLLDGETDKDIISFETPLGKLLLGNSVGAEITLPNGSTATVKEIRALSPEMLKYVAE